MERESREFLTFLATILAVGLAVALFLFAGIATLSGATTVVGDFQSWGLPGWARFAVGAIEVLGALALFVPSVSFFAALTLGGMTTFLIAMGLRHGELPGLAPVALAALAFIAHGSRPGTVKRVLAEDPAQLS